MKTGKTMMANEAQVMAAASMATNPATDPVVLATALGMILVSRGMLELAYVASRIADALIRADHQDN